jgi:AbrB family looped-hinge helix DNA binding protein
MQIVTTTLSIKGRVVIPQIIRARHHLKPGTEFTVVTRSNGDILLRPVQAQRRHQTIAQNLLALYGLEINAEKAKSMMLDL